MILHGLKETSLRNMKEMILESEATGIDKMMFKAAYDPEHMYYQKFKYINWTKIKEFSSLDGEVLNQLSARLITGNNARDAVETHCREHGDLIKLICNKDLDCGVTATTLNKVFGKKFINVMLIQLAKKKPLEKIKMPVTGQLKYNGIRVIALIKDGEVTFKTRKGHTFKFPALEEVLKRNNRFDVMFDGELCFGDSQYSNHTKVGGIVNSALKGTPIPSNLGLVYNMFDTMPFDNFGNQRYHLEYEIRYLHTEDAVLKFNSPLVRMAETWIFNTKEEIQTKFEELTENGYEGLILKHWDSLYTFKKNDTWIKMKLEETADLTCTSIQEGESKYEGLIGALICEGSVDGKYIKVKVGTGLKDYHREMDEDEFFDKTIEVKYNELIQDSKDDSWSLFLPVFICVRIDK